MKKKILVIDDEKNILETISATLERSNSTAVLCPNPLQVNDILNKDTFDLVILDIWMPEKDGHEVLKEIRINYPDLPILVISGHINNLTSVELGKSGASSFLEKPFSADFLLAKINKLLDKESDSSKRLTANYQHLIKETGRKQRTIKKNVVLTGRGLHRGENNGIIISPLPENSGVVFQNIASNESIQARIENVASSNFYSTTLSHGNFELTVIEHLLSALHIYGIDNIKIKVSGEIPIFDGSAIQFCKMIEEAEVKEQSEPKKLIVIDKKYQLVDNENSEVWCSIEPHDGLIVDYTLDFPPAFGLQHQAIDLSDPVKRIDLYKQEIAPCRTFGFLDEIKQLQSNGLAQGTHLETGLLVDNDRVINSELHFPNEFARHKALDMIGDIYLFGHEVRGKVVGHFSGHRHNVQLQKQVLNLV